MFIYVSPDVIEHAQANPHAADVCAWVRGVYWFWITSAGRLYFSFFFAWHPVDLTSPFCSKSHTPAARRTGKSAKMKGSATDSQVSVVLSKQSLCELRSMQQPPQKLNVVVEALCVLTGLQV